MISVRERSFTTPVKPLVLIHGWSCSGRFFKRNIDGLAKSCRVINMDLRGHGQSDKPEWGYRISRMDMGRGLHRCRGPGGPHDPAGI